MTIRLRIGRKIYKIGLRKGVKKWRPGLIWGHSVGKKWLLRLVVHNDWNRTYDEYVLDTATGIYSQK